MTTDPASLRFVTRRECPLCDAGKLRVDRWAPRLGFAVTEVDVDSDPDLAEQYRTRVPVLVAGDRVVAEGRMPVSRVVAGLLRLRLDAGGRIGRGPAAGN